MEPFDIAVALGMVVSRSSMRDAQMVQSLNGLVVNGKRALRVMRECGLLVRQRRFPVSRRKDWGKVEASHPNHVWQSDMTKVWAGPSVGWAYLVSVIDCCTREIAGWDLSLRCRSEEALAALNRAVLKVLPFGSRGTGLTLTTDNGAQSTSARYTETLNRLGITHRRTAYNHPEGNGYIERFHRSLKEEEVWLNEYQNFDQAELSIARWIEEYNHDRPHRGLHGRTPHDARARFAQTLPCKHGPLCLVLRGALQDVPSTLNRTEAHGRLRLLYIGRLDPKKGIEGLLKACSTMPGNNWQLRGGVHRPM